MRPGTLVGPSGEFRVVDVEYCYKPFGGLLQFASRVLEPIQYPGIYMRETTIVVSLFFSTYEFTKRSQTRVNL